MDMGKGMDVGKGKGMRMGKGSDDDDNDDECDDEIDKDDKMGKGGSKKSSKDGKKGLTFVPEYETLWSPLSPPPQSPEEKVGFNLSIAELSRQEGNNPTNATNVTMVVAVPVKNSTNATDIQTPSQNRSRTSDAKLIPGDTSVR